MTARSITRIILHSAPGFCHYRIDTAGKITGQAPIDIVNEPDAIELLLDSPHKPIQFDALMHLCCDLGDMTVEWGRGEPFCYHTILCLDELGRLPA